MVKQISHLKSKEESQVYPGVYRPLNNEPANTNAKPSLYKRKRFAPTTVKELSDSYVVETSLPAAKREDFLARSYGNQIRIDARIKVSGKNDAGASAKQEPEFAHFNRKVVLPENADTAFVSAEYCSGVLRFCIPKVLHPVKPRQSIIVVY